MNWQVYIILCADDSLYTGSTTDVERRFSQHLAGNGAKYFRGRPPRRLVYLETGHDRSSAGRREAEIKRLRPAEKRLLVAAATDPPGAANAGPICSRRGKLEKKPEGAGGPDQEAT